MKYAIVVDEDFECQRATFFVDRDAYLWLKNTMNAKESVVQITGYWKDKCPTWSYGFLTFGSESAIHAFAGKYLPLQLVEWYVRQEEEWVKQDNPM